jgi:hypothetical protein
MTNARILLLSAVAALCACHGDSGQSAAGAPAARKHAPAAPKKGPTPQELTAGMVEAVTQGKSQVPVALKFDISERPAVGKALEISIALLPRISADQTTIQVSAPDGLDVAPDQRQIDLASVDATQVYRHTVSVTPTADGVLLLGFTVTLNHSEITESRTFSIPIIVGPAQGGSGGGKQ